MSSFDFSNLSNAEKMLIANELLGSVFVDEGAQHFSSAQMQEIEARMRAVDAGEMKRVPWEVVQAELTQKPQ